MSCVFEWNGDFKHIRFAFAAAIAFRRLTSLAYSVDQLVDDCYYPDLQVETGHSVEEVADQFAETWPFIESLTDEARALLVAL